MVWPSGEKLSWLTRCRCPLNCPTLPGQDVPEKDRTIATGGNQSRAVACEGDRMDGRDMTVQGRDLSPPCDVPESDGVVLRAGSQQPAWRIICDAEHLTAMAFERRKLGPRVEVPDLDRLVSAARDQRPAVGRTATARM